MQQPAECVARLQEAWLRWGNGEAPERAAVDPEQIKPLLPYLYIAEFESEPFRVVYRLTGSAVDEWLGVNVVGHHLDEFLAVEPREPIEHLIDCYRRACVTGMPVIDSYKWPNQIGEPMDVRFGLFPLKVDGIVRQCLAIEEYSAFPERRDIAPWALPAPVA